jgi:hypothetical protein
VLLAPLSLRAGSGIRRLTKALGFFVKFGEKLMNCANDSAGSTANRAEKMYTSGPNVSISNFFVCGCLIVAAFLHVPQTLSSTPWSCVADEIG